MLTITGTITAEAQKSELLAGRPAQRDRTYSTPDVGLVARALALGAKVDAEGEVTLSHRGATADMWPRVPADAAEAVAICEEIAAAAAQRAEASRAAELEEEAARTARTCEEARAWCALPAPTPDDLGPSDPLNCYSRKRLTPELHAAVVARTAAFDVARGEKYRLAQAAREAMVQREAERAAARLATLRELVRLWGTKSQLERLTATPDGLGLLPELEAVAVITDATLPIVPEAELSEYAKITGKDVRPSCVTDYEPHSDFAFRALDVTADEVHGLTADEWATIKAIKSSLCTQLDVTLPKIPGEVTVTITERVHMGQCREEECPIWPVRRVGVRVVIVIAGVLEIEREYGAPLGGGK
jgi:hypothetical protein